MRTTLLWKIALCAVASIGLLAGESLAKNGPKKSMWKAKLKPCCDALELKAGGQAKRQQDVAKGTDRFQAGIEIPLPSLGILDPTTATDADIRLVLKRADVAYAECLLAHEESDEDETTSAEYNVDVQLKKGVTKPKRGVCDIDLTTAEVQIGIPVVQTGDVATVLLVVDPADRTQDLDLLQGTFQMK